MMKKFLYRLRQFEKIRGNYYSEMIVCAKNAEEAKRIHPNVNWSEEDVEWCCEPEAVMVQLIGIATDDVLTGIVCKSFQRNVT